MVRLQPTISIQSNHFHMNKNINIPVQDLLGQRTFEIKHLMRHIDREALNEKPHKHQWQEIIFVKSGTGKHSIDDKVFELKSNTFYLIGKGQVHDFIEGQNLEGYILRFVDNFLPPTGLNTQNSLNSTLLGSIIMTNELHVPSPECTYYEFILKNLFYEYKMNNLTYAKSEIIQYLLLALLSKLERRVRQISKELITNHSDKQTKNYHSFLLLIEENFKKEHQISFYSKKLGIDTRKLTSITKFFLHKTPKQILNERLMVEAKRMLLYTSNSSKEISYHLGYEDPAYFSRFFKISTGFSPQKYKSQKAIEPLVQ